MENTKETPNARKMIMDDVTQYLRETYVATFTKEDESLLMRFVDGKTFRVNITEINS